LVPSARRTKEKAPGITGRPNIKKFWQPGITAVSQLPYTGAEIAEWLFHQEKATLENPEKCTGIVKPLECPEFEVRITNKLSS